MIVIILQLIRKNHDLIITIIHLIILSQTITINKYTNVSANYCTYKECVLVDGIFGTVYTYIIAVTIISHKKRDKINHLNR